MNLGERVKSLRQERNISQVKLKDKLSMSLDMISSIEMGRKKPSLETLVKLADVLNCSTDYLLGRTNKKEPSSKNEDSSAV